MRELRGECFLNQRAFYKFLPELVYCLNIFNILFSALNIFWDYCHEEFLWVRVHHLKWLAGKEAREKDNVPLTTDYAEFIVLLILYQSLSGPRFEALLWWLRYHERKKEGFEDGLVPLLWPGDEEVEEV